MVIDAQGIALVLGAIGVLLASIGSFIVQMVALARQSDNKRDTDKKLEVLHTQGNSNLETARKLSEALGLEKGRQIGAADERAASVAASAPMPIVVQMPEQPSPLPVTVVDPDGKPSKLGPKKT